MWYGIISLMDFVHRLHLNIKLKNRALIFCNQLSSALKINMQFYPTQLQSEILRPELP